MYHTLLPLVERNALRREYRMRAGIVLCFMVSVAFLIGIVSLFPAYIRVMSEERSAEATMKSTSVAKNKGELTDIEKSVSENKALLDLLSNDLHEPSPAILYLQSS